MPAIGAAIGGLLGIGGGLTLGTIGTALAKIAAGFGLTYVAKALAGKPDDLLGTGSTPSGVQAQITAGDSQSRSFMVGRWATAGSIIFMRNWGETNKTPHAYLVQVIKLSDLPIDGVTAVYVDGTKVNWQDSGGSGRGFAVPDYRKNGIDYLWIKVHKGNQKTADDYLTSKWTSGNRDWGANHIGFGVAYAIVTSRYSEKLFTGNRPECLFQINGAKFYDPTKDISAGGTHNWSDPATFEFTNNPAVIIYNLMRGVRFQGKWVYGLQTVSPAQLPAAEWAAAIAECNLNVTNKDGSVTPQYRCGAEIHFDTEVGMEITELLKTCNGKIADCGGVYKPKIGPDVSSGAPVFVFTDDALISTEEQDFSMFPSLDDVVNGIDATFIAPDDGWQEKALPPKRVKDYVNDDDKRENIADVSYNHVWDKLQAQRLSKSILNEARRFRRHVLVLPPEAYALEPLDFVQWTSERNGYSAKLFRVESIADRSDGNQVVGIQEVDPSDYNWTPSVDEIDIPSGVTIIDRAAPQPIVNFKAIGYTIDGGSSIDRPAIRLTWTGTDLDDISAVRFEVRFGSDVGPLVSTDAMFFPALGTYDLTNGIGSGTVYAVRATYESASSSRDFVWTPWSIITTPQTPIHIEAFADDLENLINAGSASGKVITEQIPAGQLPVGIANAYRVTVYGTGVHAGESAGWYLYVTTEGVPGALMDVKQVAIGDLTTRQFPFVIEGGVVKITRANIQALQSANIAAGQIVAGHFAPGAVGANAIAAGIIDATKIKPGSLGTGTLADDAVTGAKVAPLTITQDEIKDAAIIATKIAANAVLAASIKAGEIKSNHIEALQITGAHIAGTTITGDKIKGGSIETNHIGPAMRLPGSKIEGLSITASQIHSNAITADKILAGEIKAGHFKSNEVSTRYYSFAPSGNTAAIQVKKPGAILLIGTFGYKCSKGKTLEMMITKKGSSEPIGNAKYKIKPGDDIFGGAAQVITMIDQAPKYNADGTLKADQSEFYELKPTSANSADSISSPRIVAMRVCP